MKKPMLLGCGPPRSAAAASAPIALSTPDGTNYSARAAVQRNGLTLIASDVLFRVLW
jgi:hypothetical protein